MSSASSKTTAGEVLAVVVADHVRRIEQRVPPAVSDEDDAVHRLRTAVRRLRTVLAVYRPVFDRDEVEALRGRLAEFGDVLGEVRDLEVRRADVAAVGSAARVPLEARDRLVAELDHQHDEAHRRLVEWCNQQEFADLTAELTRWVSSPPPGPKAHKSARKQVRRRLDKATRKVLKSAEAVDLEQLARSTGDELDEHLPEAHRLRKAGRRLSQSTRAVTRKPAKVLGGSRREVGALGKALQSSLGDHRDAILLARYAAEVGASVASDGGDRAAYDRLARAATRRGQAHVAEAVAAVEALRRSSIAAR